MVLNHPLSAKKPLHHHIVVVGYKTSGWVLVGFRASAHVGSPLQEASCSYAPSKQNQNRRIISALSMSANSLTHSLARNQVVTHRIQDLSCE